LGSVLMSNPYGDSCDLAESNPEVNLPSSTIDPTVIDSEGFPINAQYWNGSTWSSTGLTMLDQTFNSADTMRFSGIIENKGLSAMGSSWKATRMSGTGLSLLTDPNYTYVEAINAGTIQPATLAWDPERYWMRFSVSKVVGSGVTFAQLLPVAEDYDQQRYN
jgi:hypothetical protein